MQARDGSSLRVSPAATRAARPFDRIPSGARPEEHHANANEFPLTGPARHRLHLCEKLLALSADCTSVILAEYTRQTLNWSHTRKRSQSRETGCDLLAGEAP